MSVLEPALYALGAVLYAAHFIRRQPALGRAATGALGAGVVVHTFLLGMATVRESALPLVGAATRLIIEHGTRHTPPSGHSGVQLARTVAAGDSALSFYER